MKTLSDEQRFQQAWREYYEQCAAKRKRLQIIHRNIMRLRRGESLKSGESTLKYAEGKVYEICIALHSTMEQTRYTQRVLGRVELRKALELFR
jgi:hypothetical protein